MKSYDNLDDLFKALDDEWKALPWYKKAWEIARGLLEDALDFVIYDLPIGLRNFWFFRKVIFNFRPWDFQFNLDMFARGLEATRDTIHHDSMRYDTVKEPYVKAMDRAIQLIRTTELEDDAEWDELWTIIRGSGNGGETKTVVDIYGPQDVIVTDGTDMRRWWT